MAVSCMTCLMRLLHYVHVPQFYIPHLTLHNAVFFGTDIRYEYIYSPAKQQAETIQHNY